MKTARITATAAMGLMLFISISIVLAVLLASPGSQADAPTVPPADTLNISPVSEVLWQYEPAENSTPTKLILNYEYPYETRFVDSEGRELIVDVIPGRPPDILPDQMLADIEADVEGSMGLLDVPSFDWCYGCSATSAAMMFGYYDYSGYPNMYAGQQNGGVCPKTNNVAGWGSGHCPLSATEQGYDNLSVRGHKDDYYYAYNSAVDPYWGNWTEHGYANCTADYMGTNQYHNWQNLDGSTTFFRVKSQNSHQNMRKWWYVEITEMSAMRR